MVSNGSNEAFIRKNKVVTVDEDENTNLHYAAALDNLDKIEKIVAKKQNIDPENALGWTPLMMAVRNSNLKAVGLLLSHGADPRKQNKFGMNVFLMSVASGHLDMVERLLKHLLWEGTSRQKLQKTLSPLSLALLFGHDHIFKYLLERRFDPNAATPLTLITPAMFAAALANNKATKKLLRFKADLTLKNYGGKTASDIAQAKQKFCIAPKKQEQQPLIAMSPHTANSPVFSNFENFAGRGRLLRNSSNITPNPSIPMLCANVAPIAPVVPHMMPQMIFPPKFLPNNFTSPMGVFHSNFGFLNVAMIPPVTYFSPYLLSQMSS
ncbi:ankyrin repeat and SAM domain-containing protein 6 [Tribolium castaneum]|uniref:Ankyrin repeat and SOCS box protein 2-like Protein n=1 Tax=Tribolium castaneum TaxID=7070 RepID=D6WDS6_TRICA|nr:PREDICTED: ankyrin repeat and SAM domain-containing protein 6 [Tribolium castaneum]XP_008191144.1 PREDICTED: ankyrin repeat and SAM domain-containing protein 6 [Tribolium castaneum]XP_008191145.1 PREDICTED: ankyrin repeat and SAM domain-containing protein 6 [Tribolium castaneum]EEZ99926.1 Ankyrin repeat and SOCS box protein 2-like Protein [Tribolium castaneum]|eukprot:XP_008191143.1 PREDICTED: ankyrin repeat and SAM domain-containing protein 6 [Tribolium castaneum]